MNEHTATPSAETTTLQAEVDTPSPRENSPIPPPAARWLRPMIAFVCGLVSLVIAVLHLSGISVEDLTASSGPPALSSARVAYELQSRVPGSHATCVGDLPPDIGATSNCSLLIASQVTTVRATVVDVQGMNIDYKFDVVG